MLNKRERQILQILIKNKDHYTTSQELADQLECSDRTIRTYYKSLVDKLSSYPKLTLISKQGHGYKLVISDDEQFSDFLEDYHLNLAQLPYKEVSDINDRYNYLLNKLLFEQNKIYFDDLADELYVSRSTLSSDFKKIREKFVPYHLKIESKPNKGVYITGSERDKRRFIMDYFISSGFVNTLHTYVDNDLFSQKISFEELTIIVLDECREGELKLSDYVIQNLVIHIALAIRRITEGFKISKLTEAVDIADRYERKIAQRILDRISLVTSIDFPSEEVDYITLHLVTKKQANASHVVQEQEDRIRQELLAAIETLNPAVENDFQLIEGLMSHLSTMLIRLENEVILDNPLTDDIENKYPDMYQLAEKTLSLMPAFSQFSVSKDELAYIALHFMAAKERYKEHKKYNILVICATGYGSAQMLKSRIENELGNVVRVVDVIGYYEISDQKLRGVDFIISSIDLSTLIFNIPVFTVSVFLDDEEINHIRQEIASLQKKKRLIRYTKEDTVPLEPIFDEFFAKEYFLIFDKAEKQEVLAQLIHSISDYEGNHFESRMQEMVKQRELMSSVVFSDSIAVPHPLKAVGTKHRVAVALVRQGLRWSDDYPAIKLIFLISMSVYENDGLPIIANSIVDLVDKSELQSKILACQTFEEFKALFLRLGERK
ncbi:BglG family transcription antiterminator [Streptococcus dentasini]